MENRVLDRRALKNNERPRLVGMLNYDLSLGAKLSGNRRLLHDL